MGSSSPPDGWTIETGEWGVDADREESTHRTGGSALKLNSTAVATKLVGPWIPINGDTANITQGRLDVWATLQASSNGGGNDVTLYFERWNDARDTLLDGGTAFFDSTVTTVDTWEYQGDRLDPVAGSRWGRFVVEKAANAFSAIIDQVVLQGRPPTGWVTDNYTVTVSTSAAVWTTFSHTATGTAVNAETELISGAVHVYVPGLYLFEWTTVAEDPGGTTPELDMLTGLVWNGAATPITNSERPFVGFNFPITGTAILQSSGTFIGEADANDTYQIGMWNDTGGDVDVLNGYFKIVRLQ